MKKTYFNLMIILIAALLSSCLDQDPQFEFDKSPSNVSFRITENQRSYSATASEVMDSIEVVFARVNDRGQTLDVTVTLEENPELPTGINEAIEGTHFSILNKSVQFNAEQQERYIYFKVITDQVNAQNEYQFVLKITNTSNDEVVIASNLNTYRKTFSVN